MLPFSLLLGLAASLPRTTATNSSAALSPVVCTSPSSSQPNPIANDYAEVGVGTGTANGTLAVIPIDYATARSIVPPQYPILSHAYAPLFPSLAAADLYPVRSFLSWLHLASQRRVSISNLIELYDSRCTLKWCKTTTSRKTVAPQRQTFPYARHFFSPSPLPFPSRISKPRS